LEPIGNELARAKRDEAQGRGRAQRRGGETSGRAKATRPTLSDRLPRWKRGPSKVDGSQRIERGDMAHADLADPRMEGDISRERLVGTGFEPGDETLVPIIHEECPRRP
jgi:hypothetical protein